jgi:hypothetical protein
MFEPKLGYHSETANGVTIPNFWQQFLSGNTSGQIAQCWQIYEQAHKVNFTYIYQKIGCGMGQLFFRNVYPVIRIKV